MGCSRDFAFEIVAEFGRQHSGSFRLILGLYGLTWQDIVDRIVSGSNSWYYIKAACKYLEKNAVGIVEWQADRIQAEAVKSGLHKYLRKIIASEVETTKQMLSIDKQLEMF
jgi:hypothetical protein